MNSTDTMTLYYVWLAYVAITVVLIAAAAAMSVWTIRGSK